MFLNHFKYRAQNLPPEAKKYRSRKSASLPIDNSTDLTPDQLYEMKVSTLKKKSVVIMTISYSKVRFSRSIYILFKN